MQTDNRGAEGHLAVGVLVDVVCECVLLMCILSFNAVCRKFRNLEKIYSV